MFFSVNSFLPLLDQRYKILKRVSILLNSFQPDNIFVPLPPFGAQLPDKLPRRIEDEEKEIGIPVLARGIFSNFLGEDKFDAARRELLFSCFPFRPDIREVGKSGSNAFEIEVRI